jgi:hypothetical protein
MTKETQDEETVPSKGLMIEPPPTEAELELLYRVVYVIDINAKHPRQAAERAHTLMQDPESLPPVLDVLDSSGRRTRVDLSGT